jgi:hypothetical protein
VGWVRASPSVHVVGAAGGYQHGKAAISEAGGNFAELDID